jgi:nicotinamide-nucleotide amidase
MTPDDARLSDLAVRLAQRLAEQRLTLVTVESCTGGYLAKLLTDVAGSSQWFEAGYVTYSNAAKQRDVGVHAQTLLRHGAVSEATVREMAEGAVARTGADLAVSISGVAGPTGGTARNPVGSVWFALARARDGRVSVGARHRQIAGDRDAVRRQAVETALTWLLAETGSDAGP